MQGVKTDRCYQLGEGGGVCFIFVMMIMVKNTLLFCDVYSFILNGNNCTTDKNYRIYGNHAETIIVNIRVAQNSFSGNTTELWPTDLIDIYIFN